MLENLAEDRRFSIIWWGSGAQISMEGWLCTNMQTDFALQNAKSFTTNICFFQCLTLKPGVIMGTHQTRELIGGLKHVVFLKWDGDPIMKHRNCSGECRTWSQKPRSRYEDKPSIMISSWTAVQLEAMRSSGPLFPFSWPTLTFGLPTSSSMSPCSDVG